MSMNKIKEVFDSLKDSSNTSWELLLLRYKTTKKLGTTYFARKIEIYPETSFEKFLSDLAECYIGNSNPKLDKYEKMSDYDGANIGNYIYKLNFDNPLISDKKDLLIKSLSEADTEASIADISYNAYVISGEINSSDNSHYDVKLITLGKPIKILKHKFGYDGGVFKEYNKETLSLLPSVNIIVINDDVYFLDMSAENFFDLERTYKFLCEQKTEEISQLDIFSNENDFKHLAKSGHNPRKFVTYNKNKVEYLKEVSNLKIISEKFDIKLNNNDKVDTSDSENINKFIKFICDRGMIDPVDEKPREVASAQQWK